MPSWVIGLAGCLFQTHRDGHSERVNADCLVGLSGTSHSYTNMIYVAPGPQQASIKFGDLNPGILFVNCLVVDVVSCKEGTAMANNMPQFGGWKD